MSALAAALAALVACGTPAPRLDSQDAAERSRAARTAELADLVRLVGSDPSILVRYAALERLHDQALLWAVARDNSMPGIRAAALRRITDREALARYTQEPTTTPALVRQANERIAELLKQENARRAGALAGLPQTELERLARTEPAAEVRLAAVRLLEDRTLLTELADKDGNAAIKEAAAARLKAVEKERLLAIARNGGEAAVLEAAQRDPSRVMRLLALDEVRDWEALERIGKEDTDSTVRLRARNLAQRLKAEDERRRLDLAAATADPQVLARLARDPSPEVRKQALRRIDDQALLFAAAIEDTDGGAAAAAAARVQDPMQQRMLFDRSPHYDVRVGVLRRLKDEALSEAAALQSTDLSLRYSAALTLQSDAARLRVLRNSKDPLVGSTLVQEIKDQALLVAHSAVENDAEVQRALAKALRDPEALTALALRTRDAGAACIVIGRTEDAATVRKFAEGASRLPGYAGSVAALRLLMLEPLVVERVPKPALRCEVMATGTGYYPPGASRDAPPQFRAVGSAVTVRLLSGERELVKHFWNSEFPPNVVGSPAPRGAPMVIGANVDIAVMISALAREARFTSAEAEALLLSSPVSSMRRAAVGHVEVPVLERLASDTDVAVRDAAVARLRSLKLRP